MLRFVLHGVGPQPFENVRGVIRYEILYSPVFSMLEYLVGLFRVNYQAYYKKAVRGRATRIYNACFPRLLCGKPSANRGRTSYTYSLSTFQYSDTKHSLLSISIFLAQEPCFPPLPSYVVIVFNSAVDPSRT